jgi:hypothetical protein
MPVIIDLDRRIDPKLHWQRAALSVVPSISSDVTCRRIDL